MTDVTDAYDAAERLMELLYELDMVESVNYEAFDGSLEATFRASDVVKLAEALEIAKARWELVDRVNRDYVDDLMGVAVDPDLFDEELAALNRDAANRFTLPLDAEPHTKKRRGLFGRRH